MLEGLQDLCSALQEQFLVSPVQIGDDFRIPSGIRRSHAHGHLQLESRRLDSLFQELPERIGGSLSVELAILDRFLRHESSNEGTLRLRDECFYDFLPRAGLAGAAATGCVRFSHTCCKIPTRLLVRIYTARPLEIGEIMKIPAMVMGMIFIIICCCGSVAVIGVIFETRYIESPMMIGST